jgi:serine/threonine-protein kinase
MDPHRRPSPRTRGANVPDVFEAVCVKALSVDPKARFASVVELWAALSAGHGGGHHVTAVQPVVPPPSMVAGVAPLGPTSNPMPHPVSIAAQHLPTPAPGMLRPSLPMSTPLPSPPQPPVATPPIAPPPTYGSGQLPPTTGRGPFATPASLRGPPPGTRPPTLGTPIAPPYPPGPGYVGPGPWPRRLPFARVEGTSPLLPLGIALIIIGTLFAGTCAALHAACG